MTEAAQAPPPPPPPRPDGQEEENLPKRFGKYTLLRRIAVGGMAEIYLALQKSVAGFEKLIVVKRVLRKLAADPNFVTMLLDEARIAATLNHPNIAQIYDVGKAEGDYYIAMEHVHGEDLRSIVRQMKKKQERAFPLEHTLAIILGMCKGLSYAHERTDLQGEPLHIVHRDVSPQNVLVTFSGDVKLVDFGIAKATTTKEDESKSKTQLKGKVPYMSPEQAQALELDARSDIFSLGVMLFELCTGRRLFRGPSEFETLKLIVESEYPKPRSINPRLHPRLEEIILRALEKDRDARYQTAREFQADLESFIRDEQLAVSPLSLGEWMQHLFDEKLAQQKQMLQEGRQLAEVLAAQALEDEENFSMSGVVAIEQQKTPWVLLAAVLALAIGGAVAAYFLWPEPPPPIPTGPGVLVLNSDPPGAAVWIDGERRAERTPATIEELPLGTYEVRLTSEGFEPLVQSVELTQDAVRAEVGGTLQRPTAASYGVVRVRTEPEGATVLLDGRAVEGTTPLTVPEITPGTEHTLSVTLDGYQTHSQTMLFQAGQIEQLDLTLERTPLADDEALLVLTVDPANVRLVFDGESDESGSPFEVRTTAGDHRLQILRPRYRNVEREIRLPGGEVTELEIELERAPTRGGMGGSMTMEPAVASGPGQLTFDARPWCNVRVGGRNLGQTPIVNQTLPSGSHRITCVNPDLGVTRNLTVTIEPGETTRRRINLQ